MPRTETVDVVTFGETMLRLSPPNYGRLEEAVSLEVRIGGSESNTAVALARLGCRVRWMSQLPDNPLGRRIENEIRRWGVDTSRVRWDSGPGARAGLYFLDFGVAPRHTDVTYDRVAASITRIRLESLDTEQFEDTRLLHLTGITPALGEACAEAVQFLVSQATAQGVAVSFDVNYRSKLWSPAEARRTLSRLLPQVDLLLCPLSDAATIFGLTGTGLEVARAFAEKFGNSAVVITCGGDGARACDSQGEYEVAAFRLEQVVDRVGAGDAFNAGVLMGYLENDLAKGLRYGMAMAALKHTMPGDLLLSSRAEIESLLEGSSYGIRR